MLKSKRFWFGLFGILSFTLIAMKYATAGVPVDFLGLGLGVGLAITPAAAAVAAGHVASKEK